MSPSSSPRTPHCESLLTKCSRTARYFSFTDFNSSPRPTTTFSIFLCGKKGHETVLGFESLLSGYDLISLNLTTIRARIKSVTHPWWVYLTMSGDSSFLSSILEILRFCSMARTAWMSVPGVAESASTRKMPPELRAVSEVGGNQHRSFLEKLYSS